MLLARLINGLHILLNLKGFIMVGALSGVGATVLSGPWRLTSVRRRTGLGLALTFGLFVLSDVLLMMALPRLGLSYRVSLFNHFPTLFYALLISITYNRLNSGPGDPSWLLLLCATP